MSIISLEKKTTRPDPIQLITPRFSTNLQGKDKQNGFLYDFRVNKWFIKNKLGNCQK
ncbi:hypothetical protein IC582_019304 [Cucumis melo]